MCPPVVLYFVLLGVSIMKLSCLSDTDHTLMSSVTVQMLGVLPLPCPTHRILWLVVVS